MSEDMASTPFQTKDKDYIIERNNTHTQWTIDAEGTEKKDMPKTFNDKMKWIYRKVMLINLLKSHTVRNGVPLNCVVRDNIYPIARNNPSLLDDYADRTPLEGILCTHDAAKVHLYIICLISENTVSEQKVFPNKDDTNGGEDFLSIKDFYEGVGLNAKSILEA